MRRFALLAVLAVCGVACGAAPMAVVPDDAPLRVAPADPERIHPVAAREPQLPVVVPGYGGGDIEVTDVSRIVPLTGAIAETVFSLGLGDRVVGRDVAATFAEAADLPVVTQGHDVSSEGVLSLGPTLVLADELTGPAESLAAIANAGVPVALIPQAWTLEDIWPRITAIATALGVPDAGAELNARTQARVAAATRNYGGTRPPTVAFLYLRSTVGVYLLGGDGSGADALLEAVGAVDAGSAAGLGPFTPLTSEAMARAAPDVILVMTDGLESVGGVDGLVQLPGVAQTPAGRQRRVIAIEDGLLLSFGPRTPQVLDLLGAQLAEAVDA